MKHYCDEWIQQWCLDHGWTDLHIERYNNYWAFPPGAVMPEPIPNNILREIKATNGFSLEERRWLIGAGVLSLLALVVSYFLKCPMPVVFGFAFDAITFAQFDDF
jgi:hypothetical protein